MTVDAWLGRCEDITCIVVPSEADLTNLGADDTLIVSVGYDPNFDAQALPLVGKRVLIDGTIDAASWRTPDIDRGDAIQPISIELHPEQTEQ